MEKKESAGGKTQSKTFKSEDGSVKGFTMSSGKLYGEHADMHAEGEKKLSYESSDAGIAMNTLTMYDNKLSILREMALKDPNNTDIMNSIAEIERHMMATLVQLNTAVGF